MSKIPPGLPPDVRMSLLEPERRSETATPGSDGAFANLLRTLGGPQLPTSAEPFEANDLVGHATSPISRRAHESPSTALPPNAGDLAAPTTLALQPAPSVRSYGSERHQAPTVSSPLDPQISRAGPVSGDSDTAKGQLSARSPFAAQMLDPISKATEDAAAKEPSRAVLIAGRAGAGFTDAPGSALALADTSATPPLAPQNLDLQGTMQPAPRRQSEASSTSLRPGGNAAQEKVRNLILEQARQQANNSSLRVAIFAVEDGIRVVARVGVIHEAEKVRLRESIAALLAERGLTDAGVIIQTPPQPGNRSRQG